MVEITPLYGIDCMHLKRSAQAWIPGLSKVAAEDWPLEGSSRSYQTPQPGKKELIVKISSYVPNQKYVPNM